MPRFVRQVAATITSPIQRILAVEAASGILLVVATIAAFVWANVWPASYVELWQLPIGAGAYERSLQFWVNDGMMTAFFFVAGLEIRREIFAGELATWKKAALPLAAALGGMLVPAAIYAALNTGRAGSDGWAIPMATDIAFAVGVLTLLGSRVPSASRVLLLALAVIDDIGAIVVIAAFYSVGISIEGLAVVGGGIAGVLIMRRVGVNAPFWYLAPGFVIWIGLLLAGVHPTLGGVVLGLLTPVRPAGGSPADRLIQYLHPWVAFVAMPVFALANAGVTVGGGDFSGDHGWLFAGIVAGLALGKPLGIAVASFISVRLGIATRSDTLARRGVVLVGIVGGIGFTMSLFIAQLAFPPGPILATAKLAILVGAGIATVVGLAFGRIAYRNAARVA